jgi:hypothetical protein
MKNFIKLIFLLVAKISFAQDFSIIKNENFSGAIIPKEHFCAKSDLECFTPTEKEIYDLEKIIVDIQNKKEIHANRHITSDINFYKYIRQYSGFYIGEEKAIFIRFVSKEIIEKRKLKWDSELLSCINTEKIVSMNYFIKEQKFYELNTNCGDE